MPHNDKRFFRVLQTFCRRFANVFLGFCKAQGQTSWETEVNHTACLRHSSRQLYSFANVLRMLFGVLQTFFKGFANVFLGFCPSNFLMRKRFFRVLTQKLPQKQQP